MEISAIYNEQGHGVAFHPSGFHIVVGFTDKLRFINIIDKKLVTYKEIPLKSCKDIHFCNGGHMVAVSSGNIIHVFNFYTGECPPNYIFKGQETNITSIHWAADDMSFFSSNWSGIIERSKLSTGTSEVLYSLKGTKITSLIEISGKEKLLYAGTSDRQIRSFNEKTPVAIMDAGVILGNFVVTKNQEYVIAGIEENKKPGSLRVYKYPFNGEFAEIEAHSTEVKKIRISYNNKYLFSAGADGTLFIFEIKRSMKSDDIRIVYSNDILYSRRELNNKVKEIDKLTEENREKFEENERIYNEEKQLKLNEINQRKQVLDEQTEIYNDFIKRTEEENELAIKSFNEKIRMMTDEYEERKLEEETSYKSKMTEEDARMMELEKELKEQNESHIRMMHDTSKKHKALIEEIEANHNEELERIKKEESDLATRIDTNETEYSTKRMSLGTET